MGAAGKCVLFSVLFVVAVGVAVCVGYSLSILLMAQQKAVNTETARQQAAGCPQLQAQCTKNFAKPPLVIISFDGFRYDYLRRHLTPNLNRIFGECGVMAPWMYASYPTKTFSNHYTIVTGLYPSAHGIVANHMFDAGLGVFHRGNNNSFNPKWWGGEPIWNTVMKSGDKAAVMFWPGSEIAVQGMRPTYFYEYNDNYPLAERTKQIVDWLLLPESERPQVINAYFNQPDRYGHDFGPDSGNVDDALIVLDTIFGRFYDSLVENELLPCVNLVVVADHGMQALTGDKILLSDYVNPEGMQFFGGTFGQLTTANSSLSPEQVVDALRCQQPYMRPYPLQQVPVRLHDSSNRRAGDLIVDLDPSYTIEETEPPPPAPGSKPYVEMGSHGYDFRDRTMRAIFLAHGPSFKRGYKAEPFQNVELYNLFTDVLQIGWTERARTNGTQGRLHDVQLSPPDQVARTADNEPAPYLSSLPACEFSRRPLTNCQNNCDVSGCPIISGCGARSLLAVPAYPWVDTAAPFTGYHQCSFCDQQSVTMYNSLINSPIAVEVSGLNSIDYRAVPADASTSYAIDAAEACRLVGPLNESLTWVSLDATPTPNARSNVAYKRVPLYNDLIAKLSLVNDVMSMRAEQHPGRVRLLQGVAFDYDHNGLADSDESVRARTIRGQRPIPTHLWRVYLICDRWNESVCLDMDSVKIRSYIFPNEPADVNWCENVDVRTNSREYLLRHRARVRDVELIGSLLLFADTAAWPDRQRTIQWRTHIQIRALLDKELRR